MKRIFCTVLTIILVFSLFGCSFGTSSKDEATFYFCRVDYAYGTEDGVIFGEQRDIAGHAGDLSYLIALYLMGPLDEELTSTFPNRTQLLSVETVESELVVALSDTGKSLTDAQFSLGCACLSMTCLELADVENITITSGERTVTMNRDSLMLFDSVTTAETTSTEDTK